MYFPRLRDLREDADMTQAQVAKLLFTSQTVYSRYERGALTIPVEHLLILADLYGVSTDYILGRTNTKKVKITASPEWIGNAVFIVIKLYNKEDCKHQFAHTAKKQPAGELL